MAIPDLDLSDIGRARQAGTAGGGWKLGLMIAVAFLVASSWLVFPYFFEGREILERAGAEFAENRSAQQRSLTETLVRAAVGPGDAEVEVLFATDEYFRRATSPRIAAQYDTDAFLVFMVTESLHVGELPIGLAEATLKVDGQILDAAKAEGPDFADHHRSTTYWFAKTGPDGQAAIPPDAQTVELFLTHDWDEARTERPASWTLPFDYPEDTGSLTSPMLILALSAGMLSATLTPCLLQLIFVYMATLTGLSAAQMRSGEAIPRDIRRRMLLIAVTFVIGVTAFYTTAGAVIGYAGKAAQIAFETYSRELAFGSGLLVVLMGLWMGVQSRAPVVCHLPMPRLVATADRGGYLRSALMAVGFSLGCMVCFSGSIMALLFIYVGTIGSASIGASILFVFSMGVAIPFLAAAFFLSRTMSVVERVSRYTPQIGLVSMIVIVGFGLILIFDQFHTVSNLIYPWLGLG